MSALFFANPAEFLIAAVLPLSGFRFRPSLLFAADLYWLSVYKACLSRFGRQILVGPRT